MSYDPYNTSGFPMPFHQTGSQGPSVNMPEPFASVPTPYPAGPAFYPAGPIPYSTGSIPYPASPTPYPAGPTPYPAGPTPYPAGPTPYPAGPVPYSASSTPYPASSIAYPAGPISYPVGPSNVPPYPVQPSSGSISFPAIFPNNVPVQHQNSTIYPSLPSSQAPTYPYQDASYNFESAKNIHNGLTGLGLTTAPSTPATGQSPPQGQGTVQPFPHFNPDSDAQALRKAMKGLGTDEQTIIDILGKRSNDQRQRIKLQFKTLFGRDLIVDLSSELSFKFKQTILALMMTPPEYDAEQLYKAIRGLGTNEETLIEILTSRNNQQISAIKSTYKLMYHNDLERDLIGDTSGHFRRLVVSLATGGRRDDMHVDIERAKRDAMELYNAGERRWGTDESKFNQILCAESFSQLHRVFDEYQRIAHRSLEQSIRSEMSGDLQMGMLAIG